MPDIFGNTAESYELVRALQEAQAWNRYEEDMAQQCGFINPTHDFSALESGIPVEFQRASQDQQAVGYLTNNMLAIQTFIDEILYTRYRLPQFVSINTSIPDGARTYGVRIRDYVGEAERISGPGWEAPSATASESIITHPIFWYGIDGEYSIDELRGAMFQGFPLDTETVEAGTRGAMNKMEKVGLIGEYNYPGLFTLPTTGDEAVVHYTADEKFENMTSIEIRNLISLQMSRVIQMTEETIGRDISDGMTVYLPGPQYDLLSTKYIGDNARMTIMKSLMEDNPWKHFSGKGFSFQRVLELSGRGASNTDRMVIGLKNSRIAEMAVPISPRVLRTMDKGRVVCVQIEAKFGPLFVKRPNTIIYMDGV